MQLLVDRRRTMNPKGGEELSYVTDGLIFHLDGLEQGNTADAWTDLVDGVVFTGTATSQSDSFYFNNTYLTNTSFNLHTNTNCTVEIVYKETVKQNGVSFASGGNSAGNIFVAPYFTIYMQHGVVYNYGRVINTKYTLSLNVERCFQNGNSISSKGTASWYGNSRTNIGARYNSGSYNLFFIGYIYAIRVYSRNLTQAEILNNQKVDNKRFSLGLSL